ncbi:hypothetical protein KAR10_08245 [bacterium]|nr:hypothetical protein [bacterium]
MKPISTFSKALGFLIIIISILIFSCEKSFGIFDNDQASLSGNISHDYAGTARLIALGDAVAASPSGTDAIYANPAGLALINKYQVGFLFSNLLENTYYNFMGYVHPLRVKGSIGFGWARLNSSGFEIRDSLNAVSGTFDDSQNVFYLGYGSAFGKHLNIGANVKIYSHEIYRVRDIGAGLDLGLQYWLYENLTLGMNFKDIISIPLQSEESGEKLPFIIKTAMTWEPKTAYAWIRNFQLHVGFDVMDIWGNQGGVVSYPEGWKIGGEYDFYQILKLRGGLQYHGFSAGLGISVLNTSLDYAYDFRNLSGLHWVSLTMDLGKHIDRALINKYYHQAQKAYQRGEYKNAIQLWERVTSLDPKDFAAKQYLKKTREKLQTELEHIKEEADNYSQDGDHDSAMTVLEEGLALDPDDAKIKIKITKVKSLQAARARQQIQDNIANHIAQAEKYYRKKDLLKALEEWEMVLALDQNHILALEKAQAIKAEMTLKIDYHLFQGIQHFNQKVYNAAFKHFQTVLKIGPDYHLANFYLHKTKKILSKRLNNKYFAGRKWMQKRNYGKAQACFKVVLEIAPEYKDARLLSQQMEIKLGEIAKALPRYEKARKYLNQRKLLDALNVLNPLIKKNIYDDKILKLNKRVQKARDAATRQYQAGIEYYRTKKIELSINSFRKSLKLDQQSGAEDILVEVYTSKGILAYRNNDLPKAISAWQEALAMQGNRPMVKKYIKRAKNKMRFLKQLFGE